MSLTSFIKEPDVAARLKPFRPTARIAANLLVPPVSPRPQLVGTAFDYLLRFEIQRLYPHAEDSGWTAEHAAECIYQKHADGGATYFDLFPLHSPHWQPARALADRCAAVVSAARAEIAGYIRQSQPGEEERRLAARAAIRLAHLDVVVRARRLDPGFDTADEPDVDELLRLLAVVPFGEFERSGRLLLNPIFGTASTVVGGADADVITGELLVDFKTIKDRTPAATALDQLFGYFLLARRARRIDPSFPEIRHVGIYSSRFGALWTHPTQEWTGLPGFESTERWFFERAEKQFSQVPSS